MQKRRSIYNIIENNDTITHAELLSRIESAEKLRGTLTDLNSSLESDRKSVSSTEDERPLQSSSNMKINRSLSSDSYSDIRRQRRVSVQHTDTEGSPTRSRASSFSLSASNERSSIQDSDSESHEENGDATKGLWVEDKDGKKRVRAGTFPSIVEFCTGERYYEVEHVIFELLYTYQAGTSPETLFHLLRERYLSASNVASTEGATVTQETIQMGVANFFFIWATKFTTDFADSPILYDLFKSFLKSLPKDKGYSPYKLLRDCRKELHSRIKNINQMKSYGRKKSDCNFSRTDVKGMDSIDIAQQLTLMDHVMMQGVRPKEFLNQVWLSPERYGKAPFLMKLLDWQQQTTNWVTTEIMKETDTKHRTEEVIKFIEVAQHLVELKNYNGLVQVLKGMKFPSGKIISEITIPTDYLARLENIEKLMDPERMFRNYRKQLNKIPDDTICLPYFDVFLDQMSYLDYTNPDTVDNDLINFDKFRKLSVKIRKFYGYFYGKDFVNIPVKKSIQDGILTADVVEREHYFPHEQESVSNNSVSSLRQATNNAPGASFDSETGIMAQQAIAAEEYEALKEEENNSNTEQKPAPVCNNNLFSSETSDGESQSQPDKDESCVKCSEEMRRKLMNVATVNHYNAGEVIMRQGVYNKKLYLVESGKVKIQKTVAGPKGPMTVSLGVRDAGKMLGEMSVLQFGVTSASVIAAEDVMMKELEMKDVFAVFKADPLLAAGFYRGMVNLLVGRLQAIPPPKPEDTVSVASTVQATRLRKYAETFRLPAYEAVIKEYYCALGRKKGSLFISLNYFCFLSKFFGHKSKEKISLGNVNKVELKSDRVTVTTDKKKYDFKSFREKADLDDCYNIMNRVLKTYREKTDDDIRKSQDYTSEETDESYTLSQKDWEFIRKGSKSKIYKLDEVIIEEGSPQQRIYYIAKGSCRVIKRLDQGQAVELGTMIEEETFGEVGLLGGEGASATVVAAEDGVEVYIIEGHFINLLMQVYPDIAGKFYKYIATILASRLRDREMNSIKTEETKVSPSSLLEDKPYPAEKRGLLQKRGSAIGASWTTRYCEVKSGVLIIYHTTEVPSNQYDTYGTKKIISLAGAQLKINSTSTFTFRIQSSKWSRLFGVETFDEFRDWIGAILQWTDTNYRFDSYAPVREGINAKWFVDGQQTFNAMADALEAAKETIFITDWFLTPELYLRRDYPFSISNRLDRLLRRKAKEGVRVYVLVWNETSIAVKLNSTNTKKRLESLHENILVIRHPPLEPLNWSHHQKTVVVDNDIAFVGGLDLCYGRWDTQQHNCTDNCHLSLKWPGKDYMNPNKRSLDHPELPWKEHIDRCTTPRMGWHDIAMRVDGDAARDVAYNFIQRWNHHKDFIGEAGYPYLHPKSSPIETERGTATVQLLRSICDWSGGNLTETSIYKAYLDVINNAEHFIYIENQFFISSTAGGGVENVIADAIAKRVIRAISSGEVFRVVVILPVIPDGIFEENSAIRYIMKWQYDTICRGGYSMLEQITDTFPEVDPRDYITFHALRSYGELEDIPVTEQIYVHAKLMIVDDRRVIIGSANINDRSFLGDRDSEIAVLTEDNDMILSHMNGKEYNVSRFAHTLRVDLWKEHLGLSDEEGGVVLDPISDESFKYWKLISGNNTKIFSSLFPTIPSDRITTLAELSNVALQPYEPERFKLLDHIHGHLVDYSLGFLRNESLRPEFTDMKIRAVDRAIFQ